MFSIITGTILLSILHALLPNHWVPLAAIANAEKWKSAELTLAASITASAHALGTVILGVAFGLMGTALANEYEVYTHIIAPALLILFGIIYFIRNLSYFKKADNQHVPSSEISKKIWVFIFSIMMFLSPCLEVQSLFVAASDYGFDNILLLGLVYALVSITLILTLVIISFNGIQLINKKIMERMNKRITAMVLIIVGIITFFIH